MKLDSRKAIFAWSLYDWANSAFATSMMLVFFPFFFKRFCNSGVPDTVSTFRLGLANSVGCIIVAAMAPLLGAIADKGSSKKKFLMFFAYMGIVMSLSLYLVSEGDWVLGFILYFIGCIGFAGGNIFYDSLITGVASEKKMDFVSGLGYSLGYLGGGLLYLLNVWMVLSPETFGCADKIEAMKLSFISVGIWWAVFSLPIFLFVKEPEFGEKKPGVSAVKAGIGQLKETFREIRHLKTIFIFLLAYFLYIDGVDTISRMAFDFGLSINLGEKDLLLALLVTQFVAFPAALAFGYLGSKIGARRGIFIAIAIYFFVCIWAAFMKNEREFYILAITIALVIGGVQALSRSFYTKIIPKNKSAEYFGFYNMLGKFAAVIGPLLIGVTGRLAVAAGFSDDIASRISITSVILLLLAGGILFYFVDEAKGREEVKYLS